MNSNIFAKANQLIRTCGAAYIGVIDENGCPSVSAVSVFKPDNIFEAYFVTGMNSNKVKRLLKDNRASVCYRLNGNNITLAGETEILTDQQTKDEFWNDGLIIHFPNGKTDPNYCIIKFTTKRVSLWIDNESAECTTDDLLTVQSRCGLLCKWCTYREPFSCCGCLAMNGKAPWGHGDCDVAMCCQNKGYTHCGECDVFPCEDLHDMSYGNDEHNDKPEGARIAVCRAWAAKNGN